MIKEKIYSLEDYFFFTERFTDGRFELVDGQIIPLYESKPVDPSFVEYVLSPDYEEKEITKQFQMPTKIHDLIVSNLHGLLFFLLKQKGLRVYSQSTHVSTEGQNGRIPDLVVVNAETEKRNKMHQIINPIVLIEVLSPSTQYKDKVDKLEEYQSISSLEEYVIVSQTEAYISMYRKISELKWEQEIIKGFNKKLILKSINQEIKLAGIYDGIEWDNK